MGLASVLAILGGLGVFLFGLRVMSAGLQKLAGDRLRAVLSGMTRNRAAGVLSGFLITVAAQSSSATTVLIVSFANAGLLTLTESIGLVMGANIGTTVTAWMVSLLGFKVNITAFALPVIGVGFPMSFMKDARFRHLSEVLIGFGLLFLGLDFLKQGVPDLKSNPEALAWLASFADMGFGSVLLFILVGTLLTIVVQSSSASTTITLTMAAKGWISYEIAAAMVLGENLGTTITATIAALAGNRNAKRVARSHTLFNVIGVLWMLPLFWVFLQLVDQLVPGDPTSGPLAMTTHLAAFHTAFNVTNTALLVWFVPQIERAVRWLVPQAAEEQEQTHLQFLETALLATPELADIEVRRALQLMTQECDRMFVEVRQVLGQPSAKLGKLIDDVKRGEDRTDHMEAEIVAFCGQMARSGMSDRAGRDLTVYLDLANDIERMGDHCLNLIRLAERRYDKGMVFGDEALRDMDEMTGYVGEFMPMAARSLGAGAPSFLAEARVLEGKINRLRDRARKRHAERMQAGTEDIRAGLIYLDMMTNLEKLGDYCFNVVRAADGLAED